MGKHDGTKNCSGTNDALVTISLEKEKYQTSVKERAKDPVEWSEQCELWVHHRRHCHHIFHHHRHHHCVWPMQKESYVNFFLNLNSLANITTNHRVSIFVLWWISLGIQKLSLHLCFDNSLESSAIFGDHQIWHQNMASRYGHQFSQEVHFCNIPKTATKTANNASLATAWNSVIFKICCKYAT